MLLFSMHHLHLVSPDIAGNGVTCNSFVGQMDDIVLLASTGPAVMASLVASYDAPMWESGGPLENVALLAWLAFDSPLSPLWQPPIVTSRAPGLFNFPTSIAVRTALVYR